MMVTSTKINHIVPVFRENSMEIDGLEFAVPDISFFKDLFLKMRFLTIVHHRSKNIVLYYQGEINFIVNEEPGSFYAFFETTECDQTRRGVI